MPETPTRADRHRNYVTAFELWFNSQTPEQRAELRKMGLDKPQDEQFGPIRSEDDRYIPEDGAEDHPVEKLETTPGDETALGVAFSAALEWCLEGRDLIAIGSRLLAVLAVWRPSLINGIQDAIDRRLVAEFAEHGGEADAFALGPVVEWASRGSSLSQVGIRARVIAYVMSPNLIGGETLAEIGEVAARRTRQSIDRAAQDFRDTFRGIHSRTMRPEINRKRCRASHLV